MHDTVGPQTSNDVDAPRPSPRSGEKDCRPARDHLSLLVRQLARQAAREAYAAQQTAPLPSDFDRE
jgi:hypothetical protein